MHNGIFYDLKLTNLLLKGIYGYAEMAEMQNPDVIDAKMILAEGINEI